MNPQAPNPDALYELYDRNLYRITGAEQMDSILDILNADQNATNTPNVQTSVSDLGSGTATAVMNQSVGSIQSGQTLFNDGKAGYFLGVDKGVAKLSIGESTANYLTWDGSILTVAGTLTASSLNIPDTTTANSFHVDTTGNTWWGATASTSANAVVDSGGNATFISLASLNKRAATNFETTTPRFSVATGGGAATITTKGLSLTTSAVATSYVSVLWDVANVFVGRPTFTCSINCNALNEASGSARAFFGLGNPTVSGSGITLAGHDHVGFLVSKDAGAVTLGSQMGNSVGNTSSAFITNLVTGDIVELFAVYSPTAVKFYYRKNGGAMTLGSTLTTAIPTSTTENNIQFSESNDGTAVDFNIVVQCAAYEH